MTFVAGIDMGAKSTKALVMDGEKRICGKAAIKTRPDFHAVAKEVLDLALQRGAVFLFPKTRCVLDIGAQSTRALRVSDTGKVREFRTNDKCAAGAGGFIERACKYLEVNIDQVGDLSIQANKPQTISSVCAVLAESEIINHVSNGETIENILRGVHNSLASRALALLKRSGMEDEVTFVGGVARQKGMVKALEETLKRKINVSEEPELVGALGAALLALRRLEKLRAEKQNPIEEARVA